MCFTKMRLLSVLADGGGEPGGYQVQLCAHKV